MTIKEKLNKELIDAQKSKNSFKVSALRMVKSAIGYKELELKKSELEDSEVIKVLQNIAKQRKESIEAYTKANRADSAKKEEDELKIIEAFLPSMLAKEELEKTVAEIITELGASSMKDMGNVMKGVAEKLKGQFYDGKTLSEMVKEKLRS